MRIVTMMLGLAVVTLLQADTGCQKKLALLDENEKMYEQTMQTGTPGSERPGILKRFVASGDEVMAKCSDQLAFDRRYALKRKLAEAKALQNSYRSAQRPFGSPRENSQSYERGVIKTH